MYIGSDQWNTGTTGDTKHLVISLALRNPSINLRRALSRQFLYTASFVLLNLSLIQFHSEPGIWTR